MELKIVLLISSLLLFQLANGSTNLSYKDKQYGLRLQPELDSIDISKYIYNPRLLNLQIKCLLLDGPCDIVGRWVKPRIKGALLGECLKCTETQKGWITQWLDVLIDTRPDLYRAGVAKYLQNTGIAIPKEELLNSQKALEAYSKLEETQQQQQQQKEKNSANQNNNKNFTETITS